MERTNFDKVYKAVDFDDNPSAPTTTKKSCFTLKDVAYLVVVGILILIVIMLGVSHMNQKVNCLESTLTD